MGKVNKEIYFVCMFFFKIDKLIKVGVNILLFILIGFKRIIGIVVDYVYYMFN